MSHQAAVLRAYLEEQEERVPLTHSQLTHWQWYRLGERRHVRQVASATRIRGALHTASMRRAVAEVVRRHSALRTRIVLEHGAPRQIIGNGSGIGLICEDLTGLQEYEREARVQNRIMHHVGELIDVTQQPLVAIVLLKLSEEEHVLILAMEHLIADGFSRGILLSDLLTAYQRVARGELFSFPPLRMQFIEYARWQQSTRTWWMENHYPYWEEHLRGCQRARFPADPLLSHPQHGWGSVSVEFSEGMHHRLRVLARLRRTTPALALLAAYAAVVLRWCGIAEMVVQFQSDGRTSAKLLNTIGYFAFLLPLRVRMQSTDRFLDLLSRVMREYCTAYEHADQGFLETQVPRPEFMLNPAFNWQTVNDDYRICEANSTSDTLACSPVGYMHPMLSELERDTEPVTLLYDTPGSITGSIYFPLNRFTEATMTRFVSFFRRFTDAVLTNPDLPLASVPVDEDVANH